MKKSLRIILLNRTIWIILVMALLAAAACWFTYQPPKIKGYNASTQPFTVDHAAMGTGN